MSAELYALGVLLPAPSFSPLTGTGEKQGPLGKIDIQQGEAVSPPRAPGCTCAAELQRRLDQRTGLQERNRLSSFQLLHSESALSLINTHKFHISG